MHINNKKILPFYIKKSEICNKCLVIKMFRVIILLVSLCFSRSCGKSFTRCEFAHFLLDENFALKELNDWICLVEASSHFNTSSLGFIRRGYRDLGIFQVL